jgi:flavin reductase (DIM6/NTAB) family NADH-FMN oxidoreductase RutF
MDPPSLLICINRNSKTHPLIAADGHFTVNLLAEGQEEIAAHFARSGDGTEDKFARAGCWRGEAGRPADLEGALASVRCEVVSRLDHRTHTIFIGEVREVRTNAAARPLLYCNRGFAGLGKDR